MFVNSSCDDVIDEVLRHVAWERPRAKHRKMQFHDFDHFSRGACLCENTPLTRRVSLSSNACLCFLSPGDGSSLSYQAPASCGLFYGWALAGLRDGSGRPQQNNCVANQPPTSCTSTTLSTWTTKSPQSCGPRLPVPSAAFRKVQYCARISG